MGLDGVAGFEQLILVAGFGGSDGFVEEGVHLCGEGVLERIELLGEFVLVEVEIGKVATDAFEAFADFADLLHVDINLDAEFLTEYVNKLDGGSGRPFAEPPDVGVEDVDSVEDGHKR